MANALKLVQDLLARQNEDDFDEAMALYEQIAGQVDPAQQDVLAQLARSLRLDVPEEETEAVETIAPAAPPLGDPSYPAQEGGGTTAIEAFLDFQHHYGNATPEQLKAIGAGGGQSAAQSVPSGDTLDAFIDTIIAEQTAAQEVQRKETVRRQAASPRRSSGSTTTPAATQSTNPELGPRPAPVPEEETGNELTAANVVDRSVELSGRLQGAGEAVREAAVEFVTSQIGQGSVDDRRRRQAPVETVEELLAEEDAMPAERQVRRTAREEPVVEDAAPQGPVGRNAGRTTVRTVADIIDEELATPPVDPRGEEYDQQTAEALLQATEARTPATQQEIIDTIIADGDDPTAAMRMLAPIGQPTFVTGDEVDEQGNTEVENRLDRIDRAFADVVDQRADYGGFSFEDLQEMDTPGTADELLTRELIQSQSFIENIQMPEFRERLDRTARASIARSINAVVSLPDIVPGLITQNPEYFEDFTARNEALNRTYGVSDPLTLAESMMESIPALFVPGGGFVKLGTFAGDVFTDQTVRELTDTDVDTYNTIFDIARVTDDSGTVAMDPRLAIGLGIIGGMGFSPAAISSLSRRVVPSRSRVRSLDEITPDAPPDIESVETGRDYATTILMDTQQPLGDIYERSGGVNPESLRERVDTDTHSGGATRVEEALNTGVMTFQDGSDFSAPIAPRTLRQRADQLDPQTRQDVNDFIILGDMTDDLRIAIRDGIGDRAANVVNLRQRLREAQDIQQRTPVVTDFANQYRSVTNAARDMLDGQLLSRDARLKLDQERPNYVPLEIGDIDQSAPLGRRLQQAEASVGQPRSEDWFVKRRESLATYDRTRRTDPFEVLENYLKASMNSRLKNDTRRAYVDGLRANPNSVKSIRKARPTEEGAYASRVVPVYRNGKREAYISTQLQADLLRFDPYIAKHPIMQSVKRTAEQTVTGPLSGFFAFTTAMRDMVAGAVLRPKGVATGGPIAVTRAAGMQMLARAQDAIARGIQTRVMNDTVLGRIASRTGLDRMAQSMADAYAKSYYHLANSQGGFSASQMVNQIEVSNRMFQQVIDTITSSRVTNNAVTNNMLTRFGASTVRGVAEGFVGIFNSIQEAPQFASVVKQLDKGVDAKTAVRNARQIAGDVTRSGRVYRADGNKIGADIVNDNDMLALIGARVSGPLQFTRESAMFFNPMVQGTRRLLASFIDDPVGTNLRAWTYVGIPTLAAYTWNEMLGEEYNDYAVLRRSSRDAVMNLYIGRPGLPPEQGIEIPLPHEMLLFSGPFIRAMYSMGRGESSEEFNRAMIATGQTIGLSSLDVSYPQVMVAIASAAGIGGVDSFFGTSGYAVREDNIGVFSQNTENVIRDLFGVVGAVGLEAAFAVQASEGEDFNAFYDTVMTEYLRRAPIAHNMLGLQEPGSPYFSEVGQYNMEKTDAILRFRQIYDEFYNPDRFNEDGTRRLLSTGFTTNRFDEDYEGLPNAYFGPSLQQAPTNPLIERFGARVRTYLQTNAETGITGIESRIRNYNKALRELRSYTVGHDTSYETFMEGLEGQESPVRELVEELNIDPTNHHGRVQLMHAVANEMSHLFAAQQAIYQQVEGEFTEELRAEGTFGPNDTFKIEEHLRPDYTP